MSTQWSGVKCECGQYNVFPTEDAHQAMHCGQCLAPITSTPEPVLYPPTAEDDIRVLAHRDIPRGEARKDDAGKLRYGLIPPGPLAELAKVYTLGSAKYGDHNWQLGLEPWRVTDALIRHVEAWRSGETHDAEDGQHHLASVAWCAFTLMWYDEQQRLAEAEQFQAALDTAMRNQR